MNKINLDEFMYKIKDIVFFVKKNQFRLKKDKNFIKKIFIILGIVFFIILFTNLINAYLEGKIKEENNKQTQYEEIQSYFQQYEKKAKDYNENVAKINTHILNEKDIDNANIFITKLAEKNNLTIANVKKNEKNNEIGKEIYTQNIEITIEGNYTEVLQFIHEVENANFFTSVDSLEISSQGTSYPRIIAKVNYKIFYEKG